MHSYFYLIELKIFITTAHCGYEENPACSSVCQNRGERLNGNHSAPTHTHTHMFTLRYKANKMCETSLISSGMDESLVRCYIFVVVAYMPSIRETIELRRRTTT